MKLVTTKSGQKYWFRDDWGQFRRGDGFWNHTWSLMCAIEGVRYGPGAGSDEWFHGEPEIGRRMYVNGRDEWWVSTEVVSIEDIS